MDYAAKIGAILRAERLKQGITQAELARALQMDPGQLCGIEKGKRRLSVVMLMRAKKKLGIPYSVLLGETDTRVGKKDAA
jgi:transcriptional regulator with XRE-family HTH domain